MTALSDRPRCGTDHAAKAAARFFADLAGQGHGVAWRQGWGNGRPPVFSDAVLTYGESPVRASASTNDGDARNMRLLRTERGWSQEFLAAETGLNRTCLSAVERSAQNISLDNIWKIALAFGVPASSLIESN